MTRLGYHIPNFTYPGRTPDQIVPTVIAQAKEAEAAGFDLVTVMDHFYQLPQLGAPGEPMLESYTLLSAIAQHTSAVRLSTLVTGNTYRNPALLAKAVTALDHVSGGRAALGIGAGWYELEHRSLGFEFGTFTDRFEKLEEALQIVVPMLRGQSVTFAGTHYSVNDAVNSPAPISDIPVIIGGSGEKKTLRMVAQYADESNLVGVAATDVPRKLEALAGHCERVGRDRSEILVSANVACCVAPTTEQAEAELRAMAGAKGWPDAVVEMAKSILVFGDPDTVGERLSAYTAAGLDGFTLSLAANGFVPERVTLLAQVANRALG